jgi:plastocyanin
MKNFLSILFVLSFVLIIGFCGNPEEGGFVHVSMMDNFFSPPLSRIPKGGEIEFINKGLNPHNAIAVDGTWSTEKTFGNLVMNSGDKTRVSFPEEGIFPYYCSFHATPDGKVGMVGTVVVGNVEYKPEKQGKILKPVNQWSGKTLRVPQDYPTIQTAVDAANPGDLILIDEGIYKEEVVVTTPSLIIRGQNRNKVIIDGEFVRGNGIMIVGADGVAVENLTIRNFILNGVFWTGVKGYRASYVTTYNTGDYGIYAFDSIDGIFEYSYASGSPDSSFYVGQCYPCRAILHHNLGENSALGYSGTNSGGDLYIIYNMFKNNFVGILPNTLDSELLPPERETTIWGNIIINNNNLDAPVKPLTWPSYGNGIIIAGGIKNHIEKNLIMNHPNHGILIIPNLQENFWLSYKNIVKDNLIFNSGRGDISIVGPVSYGNCFKNNHFKTSIPFGLQLYNVCDSPLRFILGGDLSMMMGGIAMMIEAKLNLFHAGDWKKQPEPPNQPEMPDTLKNKIEPAINVFEKNQHLIKEINYHPEINKYLNEYSKNAPNYLGSLQPVIPVSFLTFIFQYFGFMLAYILYSSWIILSMYDLFHSEQNKILWSLILLFLPFIGSLIYLWFFRKNISKWLVLSTTLTGIILYGILLTFSIIIIF